MTFYKPKILVADDDALVLKVLERLLTRNGFDVLAVRDGNQVLAKWSRFTPDLIILDIIMPDIDGLEVCQRIRNESLVPIMFVSAKGETTDRILGLALGCDDYLAKPFDNNELLFRIKAILRRTSHQNHENRFVIKRGQLTIDKRAREVFKGETKVQLTQKEFEALWLLASQPHKVFTRENMVYDIWGTEFCEDTKMVTALIKRLREKIEDAPSNPSYIETIRGVGYKFGQDDCFE